MLGSGDFLSHVHQLVYITGNNEMRKRMKRDFQEVQTNNQRNEYVRTNGMSNEYLIANVTMRGE